MTKKMARQDRIGSHKTSVKRTPTLTEVVYHTTPVVQAYNKSVRLDSGGWRTNTTKTRMNQASRELGLGFNVSQKDYDWFVTHKGKKKPFKDGMILRR